MAPITAASFPLLMLYIFILRHPRELDAIILFFLGREMGKMLSSLPQVRQKVLWYFMGLNQHPWHSSWAPMGGEHR